MTISTALNQVLFFKLVSLLMLHAKIIGSMTDDKHI